MANNIHSRTGRPFGDHGCAKLAIRYCLEEIDDYLDGQSFLEDWYEGNAYEEWPEFYTWLKEQE